MAIWNGTTWSTPGGPITTATSTISTAISPSSRVASVKSWANSIATEDNDMIYLRKKNGILYVMKAEVNATGKWERLDPKDEPVIIDVHGKNLEQKLGNDAKVVDAAIAKQEEEAKIDTGFADGWYQDDGANLYKYLGAGSWDAPESSWIKLTKSVHAGTLEYIG